MQIFYSRASERWLLPTPDCKLLLNFHLQDNQIKTVVDANVYKSSIRRVSYKQCSKIENTQNNTNTDVNVKITF